MKKILIVNLRRLGDVYTTGHLINSLTSDENNQVSLLVYQESAKAAKNLKNVSNLYTINRKEIITLKNNKLFSDGFALEQLYKQVYPIQKQDWDEIINYSNDLVGTYLCSYLRESTQKIIGVHFNNERNVVTNSDWEILFNDVLPTVKYSPIHFVDCYHKMMGIRAVRDGEKLITNTAHNALAFSNMNSIRGSKSGSTAMSKIVGIQLKTADTSKDIPESTIVGLVEELRKNNELIPVLLIAPSDEERRYAAGINEQFDNDLVVIEADLEAIASVLMNIDLLITPDTAIKHIADLAGTPVIEVSLGHSPFLKQGTYTPGSLVLTDIITQRTFHKSEQEYKSNITANDIMASVLLYFSKSKTIRPRLSTNVTLYSCSMDNLGARYTAVAGTTDAQTEIHRLMARQLINVMFDEAEALDIYDDITNFGIVAPTNWSAREKNNVTNVMKDLLGTLRSLLQSVENKKGSREFVMNLGKLIAHSESDSIVQIPVTMFKTKIECINAKTFDENAKEVELLLYDLKTDLQKVLQCIKSLEDKIAQQKKADFINRTVEQVNN